MSSASANGSQSSACRSTGHALRSEAIACTGEPHCNFAVAETKTRLATWSTSSRTASATTLAGLKLNLDGCPHACGHHWVGDLGFQGSTVRNEEGVRRQAYDILLRGGLGPDAAIARPVFRRVPAEELTDAVTGLLDGWLAQRQDERRELSRVLRPRERRRARRAGRARAGEEPERGSAGMSEELDDLEAGELSVEFEGAEPRGAPRVGDRPLRRRPRPVDGVPGGRRRADRHGLRIDPAVRVFSIDTGRLPSETFELIEELRERYPGLRLYAALAGRAAGSAARRPARAEPLLPLRRAAAALLQRPQGAAADTAPRPASTPGSPGCAATSGPAAPTSARSRSTTTTARS